MRLLESAFSLLLAASLAASFAILLLLLIRKPLNNRFGPGIVPVLWLLVLVKLLVPLAPESPVSLYNLLPQAVQENGIAYSGYGGRDAAPEPVRGPAASPLRNEEGSAAATSAGPSRTEEAQSPVSDTSPRPDAGDSDRDGQGRLLTIASLVWLGGLLALSAGYLFAALRFRKRIIASRKAVDAEILAILEACKARLGIKTDIPVYETSLLRSPCAYGLTKPGIYLPEDIVAIADSAQLAHILLHELTHLKRKDLLANFLWTLAVMLHWYNPLAWLAVKRMKADQEVACDARTLEALDEREASSYGMTLLMLSRLFAGNASIKANLAHFLANDNDMKRRITMIAKFKKGSYKLSAVAIVLIASFGAVMLTTATVAKTDANSHAAEAEEQNASSFRIVRLIDSFKWFNRLDRALDFANFDFKVPDYAPEGFRLENVDLNTYFTQAEQADLIEAASMTFVSRYGTDDEQIFEAVAAIGNGSLQEHGLLKGTPNTGRPEVDAQSFRQEAMTIGPIHGTLFTKTKTDNAKSFV
ncbi:M56 family metallopeptidase [Paenibacillus arenilitoris]|uniref:M56 family metallopeptidase n=1 Tax=Paenibacillus arenilitoris TaxID=2772299 RepID=A0A927CMW9_9BACL|nr:M56 family metallopeptidase [Paenibacillus arenilitoris]MBD2870345.1 M56 family metallopeptidase [Paenibacillus arenilitoris]